MIRGNKGICDDALTNETSNYTDVNYMSDSGDGYGCRFNADCDINRRFNYYDHNCDKTLALKILMFLY